MPTVETIITLIALAAVGFLAVLRSLLQHVLSRRDREASLNERAVKTAEAVMKRLEVALAKAHEENEALRAELRQRDDALGRGADGSS